MVQYAQLGPCAGCMSTLPPLWAVEPGVGRGGMAVRVATTLENSGDGLGGKMPLSTAGKMSAATRLTFDT
jgi:hypothetical protein